MRNGLLWTLAICAPYAMLVGCGDDETTGGGGQGGSTTTTQTSTTVTSTTTTTTTTTTSSTSTGMGGNTSADVCPGEPVALAPGGSVSIGDSTSALTDAFTEFCAPNSTSNDAVYAVTLSGDCSLSIDLTGSGGLDSLLSLRYGSCETRVAGDLCFPDGQVQFHQPAGTFWVVVDGENNTEGDYQLDISCGAPTCGDGIINPGEQCDPGTGVLGDGCGDPGTATECLVDDTGGSDTCAAIAGDLSIPAGVTVVPAMGAWLNNGDAAADYIGTCAAAEVGGLDEVFAITPEQSGTLEIRSGVDELNNPVCSTFTEPECWDRYLFVRSGDCESGTEIACNHLDFNTGINTVSFAVNAGETYYLFVDGYDGAFYSYGPYLLRFNLQ